MCGKLRARRRSLSAPVSRQNLAHHSEITVQASSSHTIRGHHEGQWKPRAAPAPLACRQRKRSAPGAQDRHARGVPLDVYAAMPSRRRSYTAGGCPETGLTWRATSTWNLPERQTGGRRPGRLYRVYVGRPGKIGGDRAGAAWPRLRTSSGASRTTPREPRDLGSHQVGAGALKLAERPGFGHGEQVKPCVQGTRLDLGLRRGQRPRRPFHQDRASAPPPAPGTPTRQRTRLAPAPGRPNAPARRRRPRRGQGWPGRGATRGGPDRALGLSPPPGPGAPPAARAPNTK